MAFSGGARNYVHMLNLETKKLPLPADRVTSLSITHLISRSWKLLSVML